MRDYGKTVSVRLYKVDKRSPHHPTFTAKFIKVKKSTPQDDRGKELYNKGALWVKMIQKAYVTGGFAGDYSQEQKYQNLNRSYQNIEEGNEYHAFEVLLGRESTRKKLDSFYDNNPGLLKPQILQILNYFSIPSHNPIAWKISLKIGRQINFQDKFKRYSSSIYLG